MGIENDIISIGFDWKRTQSDADKVVEQMQRVVEAGNKIGNSLAGIDVSGGFGASKRSAQELAGALSEARQATDEFKQSTRQSNAETSRTTGATTQRTRATKELTLEEAKASETTKRHNAELRQLAKDSISSSQSLAKLRAELALATTNRDKLPINTPEFEAAQKQVLGLTTQVKALESAGGDFRRNVGNYSSAFTGYANTLRGLRGPTKLLGEAFGIGAQEADQFRIVLEHSLQGIAAYFKGKTGKATAEAEDTVATAANTAANKANGASVQVNTAGLETNAVVAEEAAIAQTELAVATTATSTAMKLFKVALITTGIGLLIVGIGYLVAKFIEFKDKAADYVESMRRMREAHKNYVEVLNSSAESSAKEIVNLRVLEKAATDVTKPMEVRLLAVKDLQKEYPNYLGNVSKEAILHGEAAAQINLVADALFKKAFAEAASAKAADIAGKQLDLELRRNFLLQRQSVVSSELAKALNDLAVARSKASNAAEKNALVNSAVGKAQDELFSINKLLSQNSEQYAFNGKQIEFFTSKAAENFDIVKKLEVGKKAKDIKTIADVIAELRNQLKGIQSETDNGILSVNEADLKRLEKYKSAIAEIFTLKATDAAKGDAGLKLSIELNPISIRIMEKQIKDFADKTKLDRVLKVSAPDFTEAIKVGDSYKAGEIKLYDEIAARQIVVRQTQSLRELNILEEKFSKGKISQEKYEEEVLKIISASSKVQIKEQLDFVNRQLAVADFGTKAREDAEKKIAELTLAYNKIISDDRKKKQQELISELQQLQELFNKLSSIGSSIVNISVTKEKNALQDVEDTRQKNYANEVERINASTLSEEDKANKLKILEAQRQAQKEEFDRKTREASLKQAKFDKAAAISNIIINTALAVVKALPNVFLAALIGGLGAAELAVAIATPLPKYATGLKNSPTGHFGIYGEAGPEIYQEPGKDPVVVDTPTVGFIPKGTSITPIGKDEINGVMYRAMAKKTAETMSKTAGPEKTEMLLGQLIAETKNAKDRIIVHNVFNKLPPGWGEYQRSYYSKK